MPSTVQKEMKLLVHWLIDGGGNLTMREVVKQFICGILILFSGIMYMYINASHLNVPLWPLAIFSVFGMFGISEDFIRTSVKNIYLNYGHEGLLVLAALILAVMTICYAIILESDVKEKQKSFELLGSTLIGFVLGAHMDRLRREPSTGSKKESSNEG